MSFLQSAPQLPHPLDQDGVLQSCLQRALGAQQRAALENDLRALADYAMMAFARRQTMRREEPILTQWGAWGRRLDRVELSSSWREGPDITTRHALVASGYDTHPTARLEQFARVYLYHMASEFYTCPLAMTDGAASAIRASGNDALIKRVLPHFLSRDADTLWLSGQWMTENIGGSDVSHTETRARRDADGQWRLYGRKWFTSAIVGECALALARPDEGHGLALFFVQTRDADGAWLGLTVDRLKDKLGTRELPTAEIHLDGVPAWPLGDLEHGVRQIAPMLGITRTWNAVCAVSHMARSIALARDYAQRRQAFGKPLIDQPAHARTLADMQAEFEGAFALSFEVTHLLGHVENGAGEDHEAALLRLLTPLAKLWTGKLAVSIASEALECFGGNGYIEDTGLPQLLRDAQVYPIWEGTTNVLSLDLLRAFSASGITPFRQHVETLLAAAPADQAEPIRQALGRCEALLDKTANDSSRLQGLARGLAISLARIMAAALLWRQAHWDSAQSHGDARSAAALRRFMAHGLLHLDEAEDNDIRTLTTNF
ncbi:MAG: acyl-CoA dehydrogenase family protein [Rhodanobacteraceae bacterium]